MIKQITRGVTLSLIVLLASNYAIAAQTEKLTGRIYAQSYKSLLPLGNGDGVLTVSVDGIAALSENNIPSIYGFACSGMGLEDENSKANIDVYCTFIKNDNDSFDIKAEIKEGSGGKLKVIGGSGKYSGATGSGTYKPFDPSEFDEQGQGIIELQIRTR